MIPSSFVINSGAFRQLLVTEVVPPGVVRSVTLKSEYPGYLSENEYTAMGENRFSLC